MSILNGLPNEGTSKGQINEGAEKEMESLQSEATPSYKVDQYPP